MQPGCGHGVYAAIHVVEENGQILVLGSTCFAKRFGSASALGLPAYSAGGGNGKPLTEDERQLLTNNTAELMARFKAEHDATMAAAEARLRELRERAPSFNIVRRPAPPPRRRHLSTRGRGSIARTPQLPSCGDLMGSAGFASCTRTANRCFRLGRCFVDGKRRCLPIAEPLTSH